MAASARKCARFCQFGVGTEQPHQRLVHQRGRLQGLLRAFAPQTHRRHLAQGVVQPRHQPLQREAVAAAPGLQQLGYIADVGHEWTGDWTPGLCPNVTGCVAGYGGVRQTRKYSRRSSRRPGQVGPTTGAAYWTHPQSLTVRWERIRPRQSPPQPQPTHHSQTWGFSSQRMLRETWMSPDSHTMGSERSGALPADTSTVPVNRTAATPVPRAKPRRRPRDRR